MHDQPYMILEEKLNTQFDNPASGDTNSIRPTWKEFQLRMDKSDWGI